jgi:hypothetical protein
VVLAPLPDLVIQQAWGGTRDHAFLGSFKVRLMPLVWDPTLGTMILRSN